MIAAPHRRHHRRHHRAIFAHPFPRGMKALLAITITTSVQAPYLNFEGNAVANIQPMTPLRYPQAEQTTLVSPPYDVLELKDKQALMAKNPHNVVAIDLPHVPPKVAGPLSAYQRSAQLLQDWISSGVLLRDAVPALYPYEQTYTHEGRRYQRRGMFCRVGLEEFGPSGTIHPHEQTFSGPKEDRLLLMRATRCNLSPVFGLYDDAENAVTSRLFASPGDPIATASLPSMDGKSVVQSKLWRITDDAAIRSVQALLASKHIYIADGHHRYGTSLNYRREISAGGALPADHPANFGLFVLIAMQDPGLVVMPTHRTVANLQGFSLAAFMQAAGKRLELAVPETFTGDQLPELEKRLATWGLHAMVVYDPAADKALVIKPAADDPLGEFMDDPSIRGHSAAWRALDVAILQELIFDRIIKPHFVGVEPMSWAFPHDAGDVLHLCRSMGYQAGFLLGPTPLQAVAELCVHNELMPQKSTFFYPKLATGMVINPLF